MKSPASVAQTAEHAGQSDSAGRSVALLLLVLAIVLVHAMGLRPGHEWSDDYAMYVSHAFNLISGRSYGDTGYIPNPWGVPGPATYPPVYPLLIVPLVATWGADLQMLKLFGLLMLAAALVTGYALMRPRIGTTAALAGVALFGLNPFFLDFRDEIRPDTSFLFFFLLTLWIGERWSGQPQTVDRTRIAQGLLLGIVAYLAYGTRSVGIVLLPALAVVELWRLRRLGPVLVTAALVWLSLAAAQALTLHSDASYARLLTLDLHTLTYNATHYTSSLAMLFLNGLPAKPAFALRALLFVLASLLALAGYIACLRRGLTVLEIVPWLYMLPLIVYWVGTMIQQRYMLPLFPLYLYYAWVGLGVLRERMAPVWGATMTWALALALAVSYVTAWVKQAKTEIQPGVTTTAATQAFDWVREHTPADAVVLVGRTRAFALYGQRRSVSPYGYRSDAELSEMITRHCVTHIVVGRGALAKEMDYEHPDDLARFVSAHPQRLQAVLHNAELDIYEVLPARPGAEGEVK